MKKIFFLLLSLLVSSQVMACRCTDPGPRNAYARADAVVLAKIGVVAQVQEDVTHMEAEVLQSWKLKTTADSNILSVYSMVSVCPYVGQEGETHLLYLKRSDDPMEGFWTDRCMGNSIELHAQAAKHVRWLNRHGRKM
ncbi:MAG: hypothetical protein LBE22_03040 [Azoarcus sp.]|nr:hypothetical protein [Azoarcus sp.]